MSAEHSSESERFIHPEVTESPYASESAQEETKQDLLEIARKKSQIGHNIPFNIGKATICRTLVFDEPEQDRIDLTNFKGGTSRGNPDRLMRIQYIEPYDEYFEEGIVNDYSIDQSSGGLKLYKQTYLFDEADNQPINTAPTNGANAEVKDKVLQQTTPATELYEYEKSLGFDFVSDLEARHLKILVEEADPDECN